MQTPKLSHHPLYVREPEIYLGTFDTTPAARLLLIQIAKACVRDKRWLPSQVKMADLLGVTRRSVNRYVKDLKEKGWIRVIRRGKKLTNVYRLGRSLWGRLTGHIERKPRSRFQLYLDTVREKYCPRPAILKGPAVAAAG